MKIAEASAHVEPVYSFIGKISVEIINPLIYLMMGVALLVFLWGLFQLIQSAGSGGEGYDNGKRHMIWGIVGMVVMLSALGILTLVANVVLEFK